MTEETRDSRTVCRRRYLAAVSSLAATGLAGCSAATGLAGCSAAPGGSGGRSLPAFASLLADTDGRDGTYSFVSLDAAFDGGGDNGGEDDTLPTDPLVANPVASVSELVFLYAFVEMGDVGTVVDEHDASKQGDQRILSVNTALLRTGDFDVPAAADALRGLDAFGFETVADADRGVVLDSAELGFAVGLTPDAFVFARDLPDAPSDPASVAEAHVATLAGDRSAKHERDDEFAELLRRADTSGLAFGVYADDAPAVDAGEAADADYGEWTRNEDVPTGTLAPFDGARGFVQRLGPVAAVDEYVSPLAVVPPESDDGDLSATAVVASGGRNVDPDGLGDAVGRRAEDVTVRSGDGFVRARATYPPSAFE
ncbi:hypothetical protein [Halobacterium litoreum]|uniref:Uncharacterized protein n=1 Tax=Halobacterium litoreum TaxID=2039234 RepID=A0ABD5NAG7_9EURY|nr:hypothetical protein [Halobacterium litoreum]UHH12080.1 hypothetical protein LT972_07910 [Halobacterium litoreum]